MYEKKRFYTYIFCWDSDQVDTNADMGVRPLIGIAEFQTAMHDDIQQRAMLLREFEM